jgi:hypothetical protein
MDMGAYVIVINAEQVTVTGNKPDDKLYFRHVNGRPGSLKLETFNQLQRVSHTAGPWGHGLCLEDWRRLLLHSCYAWGRRLIIEKLTT